MPPSPSLPLDLPAPGEADAAHSERLCAVLREACAQDGGSIAFHRYMELALYAPELGYYSAPRPRFGEGGDFVTAPELSRRFSRCVATQVAEILEQVGDGSVVVEAGAGSGALADAVLESLADSGFGHVPYLILELSAGARAIQRERLRAHAERVRWLDDFPEAGFRGALIANELLDALPAHRFQLCDGEARELGVQPAGQGFDWTLMPASLDLPPVVADALAVCADGYRGEYAPARAAWVRSAAERLACGAMVLLDYGYPVRELYHPQRLDGTLACHYRHRVHADPFVWPGLQDLSVHVDFTAIAEAGVAAGLDLAGYTTQAHFLMATGLLDGLDDPELTQAQRTALVGEVQRLTLPAEMGEAVKVIALSRGIDAPLSGFSGRDLVHTL